MGAANGVLAWAYLRRNPEYRVAWELHSNAPMFEMAPFPILVQDEADHRAEEFGLLAWADPEGDATPFWSDAGLLDGELIVPGAAPLVPLLSKAKTRLDGLRLSGGGLVLKIERGERTVQVRVPGARAFSADAGLVVRLEVGFGLPVTIERVRDLWVIAGGLDPRPGRVRGASTRNC